MTTHIPTIPELRSYPCFDALPEGCLAHFIRENDSDPLLRMGEIVVIDPHQRDYIDSELFLIEWRSRAGARQIVMPERRRRGQFDPVDHLPPIYVSSCAIKPMPGADKKVSFGRVRWVDGPYSPEQLATLFLGRVLGILQPAFDDTTLLRVN